MLHYLCYPKERCLREADCSFWRSNDRDLGALVATIDQSTRLKTIEMSGNNISLADGRLAIAVACNSTVTEIDLSSNRIGDVGARLLADALKRNGTVRVLDLGMNRIGDEGADFLADALKLNASLRDVALGDNKIGGKGIRLLAGALKQNRSLERISLGNNKIGDDGAGFLGDALKANDAIVEINLRGGGIGSKGAGLLAEALKKNETLRKIDLKCNQIGDEGAALLGGALEANGALEEMDLTSNDIGSEGAGSLADAIKVKAALQNLILAENRIDGRGAKSLADALEINRTLEYLHLDGNQIDDEGGRSLRNSLECNAAIQAISLSSNRMSAVTTWMLGTVLRNNRKERQDPPIDQITSSPSEVDGTTPVLNVAVPEPGLPAEPEPVVSPVADPSIPALRCAGSDLSESTASLTVAPSVDTLADPPVDNLPEELSIDTVIDPPIENLPGELNQGEDPTPLTSAPSIDTVADPPVETLPEELDQVEQWLQDGLPALTREDVAAYAKILIDDGFDSEDMLAVLMEEDLHFMKKGHRRALLRRLKEPRVLHATWDAIELVQGVLRNNRKERQDPPNDQVMSSPSEADATLSVLNGSAPEPGLPADPEPVESLHADPNDPALPCIGTDASESTAPHTVTSSVDTVADPPIENLPEELNQVEQWLQDGLPTLTREDVAAYAKNLVEDGFDSEDMLAVLVEEDLDFMKKAHRRVLLQKLKECHVLHATWDTIELVRFSSGQPEGE